MRSLGLTGLVAAPHSPFKPDGSLNLDIVPAQVQLLLEGGVRAAFVCGTTGEGPSLTTPERIGLADRWVRVAPRELSVVVHVGHTSLAEACALAAAAQSSGAAAIAALAPYFFKPKSVAELIDFCSPIASAAPRLPFYFYHLPSLTGVTLSIPDVIQRAAERIPTFAGIKYTHDNLMEFQQCVSLGRQMSVDVLFGRDEILLAGLAAGARGAIGSTYNYAAPVYHKLMAAVDASDLSSARDFQAQAVRLVELLRCYGEIAAAKAILAMMGVNCGPPRPPLAALTPAQIESLSRQLEGLDIFTRPVAQSSRL
jgi:N-acetylneuraminate lyase